MPKIEGVYLPGIGGVIFEGAKPPGGFFSRGVFRLDRCPGENPHKEFQREPQGVREGVREGGFGGPSSLCWCQYSAQRI